MIGSEDPEYIVSEEEVQNAQIEMFMYANELAAERRDDAARRHRHDAARRRGRRRHALGDGLQPVLPADRGRRQRDDAQLDLARHHARSATTPSSTSCSSNDPTLAQSATEEIVRWASPVMYFRRNVTKDTELGGQQLKAGDKVSIWYVSREPRRGRLRRPVHVRHPALARTSTSASAAAARTTASARTSPAWRSTCCSRRWPAASRRIERAGDVQPLRSNFIGGIKHMPVKFPKGKRES